MPRVCCRAVMRLKHSCTQTDNEGWALSIVSRQAWRATARTSRGMKSLERSNSGPEPSNHTESSVFLLKRFDTPSFWEPGHVQRQPARVRTANEHAVAGGQQQPVICAHSSMDGLFCCLWGRTIGLGCVLKRDPNADLLSTPRHSSAFGNEVDQLTRCRCEQTWPHRGVGLCPQE